MFKLQLLFYRKMALARRSVLTMWLIQRNLVNISQQNSHKTLCCLKTMNLSTRLATLRRVINFEHLLIPPSSTLNRFYAKGKKKASKSSKSDNKNKEHDLDEGSEVVNMTKYQEELDNLLDGLKQEFMQNMALRTSFASFDKLIVKTDDGNIPLNQIAAITQKSPTLVMLDLNKSRKYVPNVMDALQKSSMNLNPQQEKTHTIFINIPKVSREHRENMAKGAKTKFNETKEKMSKVYNKYLKQVNTYINNKGNRDMGEDAKEQLLKQMREEVDKAETMMKAKQKELLS